MLKRLTLLMVLGLAVASAPRPSRAEVSAIAAPVLKWQYGGCEMPYCERGWYSSPAVADLDGDNQPEVIWGSYDVVALNGANGSLQWRAPSGQRVWPGIAVADIDNNTSLEVIVGRSGNLLTVYNGNGAKIWELNPFSGGEVRTLAVTDLEQDGQKEIIVGRGSGGSTRQINVFGTGGAVRPGFPARRDGEPGYGWGMYNENVAVADLNNDGYKEIFAPTDTHYITAVDRNGNQLAANPMYGAGKVWSQVGVHVDQAADLRGYANCGTEHRPNFANAAPAVADVNGDGTQELIALGDVYNCNIGDPDGDLYYLPWILKFDRTRWSGNGFDWTVLPAPEPGSGPLSQDYEVIEYGVTNTVVADLDLDGFKEILYPSYDGRLHAFWLDKTEHGNWPFKVPGTGIRFAGEPAVVDIDNDGKAEILFTSWPESRNNMVGQLHVLDSLGNQLYAVNLPAPAEGQDWNGGLGAPTVANIDGDADLEVVVGTAASGVVAYDLPGSAAARILWGTGRGSYERTGVAKDPPTMILGAVPSVRRISHGGTASYTLKLTGNLPGTTTFSATVPAGLNWNLTPSTSSVPGQATLTLTDTHAQSQAPGRWYSVTVKATNGPTVKSIVINLLVDGTPVSIPRIQR
ncbi:MAG TPA: VCBS repeat-containing protein [Herpetosiphonaceae bacterium]|nr:VCBS repeat-containing protein [Herpetosiphonaceae bacterium]